LPTHSQRKPTTVTLPPMDDAAEKVILVDADDRTLGTAPKLDAHRRGQLHRAFSVLIDDGNGNLLLQKRHAGKYHSGGLWTNACCGHPRPGEETLAAAERRLHEEMGIACALSPLGTLVYRADVGRGLVEHELVHVYGGKHSGAVHPDAREAEDYAWRPLAEVLRDAKSTPQRFTAWFQRYLADGLMTARASPR
jgi:isopentenyl-diphosphate Delta-isomerase